LKLITSGPFRKSEASSQERGKLDQMPVAVRHQKIGQPLAEGRHETIGAVGLDARDETVVGRLEIGEKLAGFSEVEFQPCGERSLKGIRLVEGFGEGPFE
jgi:hypothetical protein